MFGYKEEFKREFEKRIIEKYGSSVETSHITERFEALGSMVRDYASINWKETKQLIIKEKAKQVYYFSMEFLIGRLLVNNMQNLGIYHVAKEGLTEFGIDIHDLENLEADAGLGNGGLGRLAACFMDSSASLSYPVHGCSIRYEYGFFKQKIEDGHQIEVPDQWLTLGNVWEIRKPKHAVEVSFYGDVKWHQDEKGKSHFRLENAEYVKCVPYDIPIIGYENRITNTLRLWSAEPSNENLPNNKDFHSYLNETKTLCHGLYPDDSTEQGKILRLKQQYFLVSSSLQAIIKAHLRYNRDLKSISKKITIQLNDTHPILAIPELMRLLVDVYDFEWEESWKICTNTFAYTNHTVMAEALEKWPVPIISRVLPRIYMIIEEINKRWIISTRQIINDDDKLKSLSIISDSMVHMANLGIVGSFSVNGVAALHTTILKNELFHNFYYLNPEKFNNKTNGITHRRWLLFSNPQLAKMITDLIGSEWICKPDKLNDLMAHVNLKKVQNKFLHIKKMRKIILADYIKKHNNVIINPDSIFDIQVKRLHSYKRQLLNVFHIIYLYQQIKNNSNFRMYPRTFIFGAKAAPSYLFAKNVIELIVAISKKVNSDPEVNKYMKVVFIENYDVSKAEIIMPAADVSEQISTAGKEASGTGNMKFMLNGAITLGTLDGANVEIYDLVNDDMVLFGLKNNEVIELKKSNQYNVWDYYNQDLRIKKVIDSLKDGTFGAREQFNEVYNELMYKNDEYMLLADFDSYLLANEKIASWYDDESLWAKKCLVNIAAAGYFSSDRTIEDYVKDIWGIQPLIKRKG